MTCSSTCGCQEPKPVAAGNMNPNAQGRVAAAPALLSGPEHLRLRGAVADAIVLLGRLLGPGVVEQLRRDYDEVASQAWTLDRIAASQAERLRLLEELLYDAQGGRDSARRIACALEAELAQWRDVDWLATYTTLLEARVTETDRDWCVGRANDLAAERRGTEPAPVEVAEVGMLPVVDDHSLPEHALQFRNGDRLVAVGRVDRLFAPLDTATEIALGATETDLPDGDAARPLDELDLAAGIDVGGVRTITWPDGAEWRQMPDGGPWLLTDAPGGQHADVAAPRSNPDAGSRRIRVGEEWGPYDADVPIPAPPGPPSPPRPAGHHPVA